MKKQIAVGFALIAAVLLIACQSEKPQSGERSELQTTAQTDSTADMQSAAHHSNSASGEGDLQESHRLQFSRALHRKYRGQRLPDVRRHGRFPRPANEINI